MLVPRPRDVLWSDAPLEGDAIRGGAPPVVVIDGVVTGSAAKCIDVVIQTAFEPVIACAADQRVVAVLPIERIVAGATLQAVVARSAGEHIVAPFSSQDIIGAEARDVVGTVGSACHHLLDGIDIP